MVERGQGGVIVNMSSVAGLRAVHDHTIYCSTKGALDMLTRTMALELGPHKVCKKAPTKLENQIMEGVHSLLV